MVTDTPYNPAEIEPRWQAFWAGPGRAAFTATQEKPGEPYYILDMFPYPSGAGLHLGHIENYTATDALKRFKIAQGCNVLHPMGWDAFGLPTEQYAIKTGEKPEKVTAENITTYKRQMARAGFVYDWEREVNTTDPSYFRWTQWIFRLLFKRGLAYVEEKPVWYCPELATVLANEEVLNTPEAPRSERGQHPVERRPLRQWVLRITAYADQLLDGLAGLDWPDSTKRLQANWIGRSEGAEVHFAIDGHEEQLTVFTTRPDTLFGVTYMVLSPEHPLVAQITRPEERVAVAAYCQKATEKSDLERAELAKEKTGVPTGAYAINPVNGEKVPIWVADYVLMSYGTGAIMAVPAHDTRDFAFAHTFGLPIKQVIFRPEAETAPTDKVLNEAMTETEGGVLGNSGVYDGMSCPEAIKQITASLAENGLGRPTVNFKLRDWLFSRQRYWGEPFPIVWIQARDYEKLSAQAKANGPTEAVSCKMRNAAGEMEDYVAVALPDQQLPLTLPEVESYAPSGDGQSPLAKAGDWLHCFLNPETGEVLSRNEEKALREQASDVAETLLPALRETNTMPQWAGSCWYYLRYLDPTNSAAPIAPEVEQFWGMPKWYVGGAEHAVLHLLYARFWHRFLYNEGVLTTPEPFDKLFHQGIVLGEDGEKMSKSRGNVVNPDSVIDSYGADALRMFILFLGPLEAMKPWNPQGIEGISRFLKKLWNFAHEGGQIVDGEDSPETLKVLHQTIKKVTTDYEALAFNTAISQLMICLNQFVRVASVSRPSLQAFLKLLAPLAPHIAEELWVRLGGEPGILNSGWPEAEEHYLLEETVKLMVQVNGKLRGELQLPKDVDKATALHQAKMLEKVASYLEGKSIVKEIYVPGRIVNLVVK